MNLIGRQETKRSQLLLPLASRDNRWIGWKTYPIVHIHSDKPVTIRGDQSSQVVCAATLAITATMDPDPDRQSRFLCGIALCDIVRCWSIHLSEVSTSRPNCEWESYIEKKTVLTTCRVVDCSEGARRIWALRALRTVALGGDNRRAVCFRCSGRLPSQLSTGILSIANSMTHQMDIPIAMFCNGTTNPWKILRFAEALCQPL